MQGRLSLEPRADAMTGTSAWWTFWGGRALGVGPSGAGQGWSRSPPPPTDCREHLPRCNDQTVPNIAKCPLGASRPQLRATEEAESHLPLDVRYEHIHTYTDSHKNTDTLTNAVHIHTHTCTLIHNNQNQCFLYLFNIVNQAKNSLEL